MLHADLFADPLRRFASAAEIAEALGETESTIRYWEKLFHAQHGRLIACRDDKRRRYDRAGYELFVRLHRAVRTQGLSAPEAVAWAARTPDADDPDARLLRLKNLKTFLEKLRAAL